MQYRITADFCRKSSLGGPNQDFSGFEIGFVPLSSTDGCRGGYVLAADGANPFSGGESHETPWAKEGDIDGEGLREPG